MIKYFYTEAHKVISMIKMHNIKFIDVKINNLIDAIINGDTGYKFYIHPDYHEMLRPRIGDIGVYYVGQEICPAQYVEFAGRIEWQTDDYKTIKSCKIIQRNGLVFFMPEVEND